MQACMCICKERHEMHKRQLAGNLYRFKQTSLLLHELV